MAFNAFGGFGGILDPAQLSKLVANSAATAPKYNRPAPPVKLPTPTAKPAYKPMVPDDFWGLSETSRSWENPYYEGPAPTNELGWAQYERFDASKPGSGIRNSGNLAASFDQAFLAGNGIVKEISLSDYGPMAGLLSQQNSGGFGGALANQWLANNPMTPELQKALDLNKGYERASTNYRSFTTDKYYLDAFRQIGIDPKSIKTREQLDAIDPLKKASVFDIVQRTKQMQNQLPPQGIAQSLGGFGGLIGPLLGSLVAGPIGGALIGAAQGTFQPGGGLSLINSVTGAAKGAGIGDIVSNGLNVFGKQIFGPIATNGVPVGVNPLFDTGFDFDLTPGGNTAPVFSPPGGGNVGSGVYGVGDTVKAGGNVASGDIGMPPGPSVPGQQPGFNVFDIPSVPLINAPTNGVPAIPLLDVPTSVPATPLLNLNTGGSGAGSPSAAPGGGGSGSGGGTGGGAGSGQGGGSGPGAQSPGTEIPDIPGFNVPDIPALTGGNQRSGAYPMSSADRFRLADRGIGRGREIGVGASVPWWSL